jgi:hypothetical protein
MLYVPLLIGIAAAWTFPPRLLLLIASVTLFFIGRESIVTWWRAYRRGTENRTALQTALIYLGLAAVSAFPLLVSFKLYLLIPVALIALLLLGVNAEQSLRREDRTIVGEALAIIGLTIVAPTAHYVALGVWKHGALLLWLLSALYFMSSVFYVKFRVHTTNSRKIQEGRRAWLHCAVYHGVLTVIFIGLILATDLSVFAALGFVPVVVRASWALARPAPRLNLKRIGVMEIIYSAVFLVLMTLTFKSA